MGGEIATISCAELEVFLDRAMTTEHEFLTHFWRFLIDRLWDFSRTESLLWGVPPGIKCPENFGLALRVPLDEIMIDYKVKSDMVEANGGVVSDWRASLKVVSQRRTSGENPGKRVLL